MLSKLVIKRVALIDEAEIEFGPKLNILSGETGAGKSVILDSLDFVLGAKADKSMVRYGTNDCVVQAVFSVDDDSAVKEVLSEYDIECDDEIIITRKLSLNGKSSIKVNGMSVNASMLKQIGSHLVDIHGQSEHFYLLKEANQLKALDNACESIISDTKDKLSHLLDQKKEIKQKLSFFGGSEEDRDRRIDILSYQISEIEKAELVEGEEEELLSKKAVLNNIEKINVALSCAKGCISDEQGSLDTLNYALKNLGDISSISSEFNSFYDRLYEAISLVDDLSSDIENSLEILEYDEEEALNIENRLDLIKSLKKKYGFSISEINEFLQKSKSEYELLISSSEEIEKLNAKIVKLDKEIFALCENLSQIRRKYAQDFSSAIIQELASLNIKNANFVVEFQDFSQDDVDKATSNGLDSIRFLFSANAGEPLKEMGKIISGGEMSRFMLAMKTQFSALNGISTYVFDEIDTGISGITAKVVAQKFAQIAKSTQIIAVSHLAQIAAMSDNEYLISKHEENGKTYTTVKELSAQEKQLEIIRLIGGNTSSKTATDHAIELIDECNSFKTTL